MINKLFIFVALAALTQSSCAQQSTVYGLSEEKSTNFRGIVDNQREALSSVSDSVHPLFDALVISSVMQKHDLPFQPEDVSLLIDEALQRAKNATDHAGNSLLVIQEGGCTAAETSLNALHADLENVYAQVGSAIRLAVSGNFTDIRTQFGVFSDAVKKSFKDLSEQFYGIIRACLNTNNSKTLAAIKVRENETLQAFYGIVDAVFDAIKVFAARIPTERNNVAVIPGINDYRKKADASGNHVVENVFSSIRGLFLSNHLNIPETAHTLTTNQYAQIVSDSRYTETVKIMFDVIKGYLTKVQLGLSNACEDDSGLDAAQAETAAHFKTAVAALVQSIPTSVPGTATATGAALEILNKFCDTATAAYFNGIRLARGQGSTYSETLAKIQTAESALQAIFPTFVATVFDLIQLGNVNPSGLTSVQNRANVAGHTYVRNIFTGIRVMAKACSGTEPVSDEDFNTLQTATNEVKSTVENFDSDVSSGHVSTIKNLNAIQTVIPTLPSIAAPILPKLNIVNFNLG